MIRSRVSSNSRSTALAARHYHGFDPTAAAKAKAKLDDGVFPDKPVSGSLTEAFQRRIARGREFELCSRNCAGILILATPTADFENQASAVNLRHAVSQAMSCRSPHSSRSTTFATLFGRG